MSRTVEGVEVDPNCLWPCTRPGCRRATALGATCCRPCRNGEHLIELDGTRGDIAHTAACNHRRKVRYAEFRRNLERSSLGTPAARALRERTPQHVADTITSRAEELRARDARERITGGPTICYACGLAIVPIRQAWRERNGRVRHVDC